MIHAISLEVTAITILLIGYVTAVSARDLIRLLIALELMFNAVFLSVLPLTLISTELAVVGLGIIIISIFTSCSECLILACSIILQDRYAKSTSIDYITAGGERL